MFIRYEFLSSSSATLFRDFAASRSRPGNVRATVEPHRSDTIDDLLVWVIGVQASPEVHGELTAYKRHLDLARSAYLEVRLREYWQLSPEALQKVWDDRKELGIDSDEIELLRRLIRPAVA